MMRKKRKTEIEELIDRILLQQDYEDQLVYSKRFPARGAKYADLKPPLPEKLHANLKRHGIERLYSHQAEAVQRVRDGESIVVATDTASGKSLCYNLPVIEELLRDPEATALYIFPTKALGQDQTRMLHEMIQPGAEYDEQMCFYSARIGNRAIKFGTYDGDTPREERASLRREAGIILTNPDMLSLGILPHHSRGWTRLFKNLRFVVIDEIHIYRGVFGSHVANLLRRLVRVCAHYGSEPRFVCCSATIGNPGEHARRMTSKPVHEITESGAPNAGRIFALWNPAPLNRNSAARRSPITESIGLFESLVESKLRTIVFARAKPTVEVILKLTRDKLHGSTTAPESIVSYRGGYLPSERRAIERSLAEGRILGVVCTNALELGVDIGSLDAAVINGYPGSIASVWQQAGRAGRRDRQALAVMVAYDEPLDQYFIRHPEYFFGRPVEQAIVHPSNPYILSMHLLAAAAELPLRKDEKEMFGENFISEVRKLIRAGELRESKIGACYVGNDYPASMISLRTSSTDSYAIELENGGLIGQMDASTAFIYLHEGAVYLHQGESHFVEKLDLERKVATVSRKFVPYYTRALSSETVKVDETQREKKFGRMKVKFGMLEVTSRVHSFKKIRQQDNTMMGCQDLEFPEDRLRTQGFWMELPADMRDMFANKEERLAGGLHAVEHAAISMLPFLAMCDRQDIGGLSTECHPDTDGNPAIFIHDAYEGGMGLAETGYERLRELLTMTLSLIRDCPCREGCPSCIQSPKCGNMNEPLDKSAAVAILKKMLSS